MSAELDVTFLGWTKQLRAREHRAVPLELSQKTVKSKQGRFSFSRHFPFQLSACRLVLLY